MNKLVALGFLVLSTSVLLPACVAEGADGEVDAPLQSICKLPIATGPCRAYMPSYGFDTAKGECVQFIYGGCEGNKNRFETLDACEDVCGGHPGAVPDSRR